VLRLFLIAFGLMTLAGCDSTAFDPFVEQTDHFSLAGVLDASADTQFVRVSRVRLTADFDPRPIDATVTLLDERSGAAKTLQDSVYAFGRGRQATNYALTDFPLELGGAYRLTVEATDGRRASAQVELPDSVPEPVLLIPARTPYQVVTVRTQDKLVALDLIYTYRLESDPPAARRVQRVPYFDAVSRTPAGVYGAQVNVGVDISNILPSADLARERLVMLDIEVFFALASSSWPDIELLTDEDAAIPNLVDNVEGGVGFVGGIASKRLSWCEIRPAFLAPPCDDEQLPGRR
ncbi:MAG: DUF4249 family protein, partial [Bacteroidota bacterium]